MAKRQRLPVHVVRQHRQVIAHLLDRTCVVIYARICAITQRVEDYPLGIAWCDPDRQPEIFATFLYHPGISAYAFDTHQMSHVQYQPHLRHLRSLPPQFAGIPAELFQIIADLRQLP